MAAAGLLALLDDITILLDDVSIMTKVAAEKTAGLITDDIAVNAKQVLGTKPEEELKVVAEVAKGSMVNKAILVPACLILSVIAGGILITPLLLAGGIYLSYEAVEKILHNLHDRKQQKEQKPDTPPPPRKLRTKEQKIKAAIRTDFILSAEILVITLGLVASANHSFLIQIITLCAIGIGATVFIYGLVAMFLRLDDLGLWMMEREGEGAFPNAVRKAGYKLIRSMPYLSRALGFFGTAAMLIVGGGILIHCIPFIEHFVHDFDEKTGHLPLVAGFIIPVFLGLITGFIFQPIIDNVIEPLIKKLPFKKKEAA